MRGLKMSLLAAFLGAAACGAPSSVLDESATAAAAAAAADDDAAGTARVPGPPDPPGGDPAVRWKAEECLTRLLVGERPSPSPAAQGASEEPLVRVLG